MKIRKFSVANNYFDFESNCLRQVYHFRKRCRNSLNSQWNLIFCDIENIFGILHLFDTGNKFISYINS